MKRLKAMALLIITAFFVLAPPGTLILIAVLTAGWIGGMLSVIALIVVIAVAAAGWIIIRARRERKGRGMTGNR